MLMIEAARSHDLAARFASGYLAVPYPEEPMSGLTHAWAQIYLPSAGWIDFDPTSGKAGKSELIVAVVRDPRDAIPLHGTFIGFPSDHLGMEVEVSIKPGTPNAIWAKAPGAPALATRVDWRRPDDDVASEGISGDVE
jgi:transglutaminase-like putative cysteine protease